MQYKKLTEGVQRAYKHIGNWGMGVTIHEKKKGITLIMDIGYENQILPIVNLKCPSVPVAKLYANKVVRNIINELGKWTEE